MNDWDDYLAAGLREHAAAQGRNERAFPHYSEDGAWVLADVGTLSSWHGPRYEHGNWTAGFWFGTAWLTALGTGRADVAALGRQRLTLLAPRGDDHTTHDLGFLFYPSLVLGHLCGFVGDDQIGPAIAAAEMLVRRFNAQGRYIQAFGPIGDVRTAGTSTIDTMMNLPLLWWAHGRTGEPRFLEVARHHARTSARLLVRKDGSTVHLMRLDAITGAFLAESTLQGAAPASAWSRGSGWAAAGFAWAYAVTGETEFLAAAERACAYFAGAATAGALPPWDFSDTSAQPPSDASAAAAVALAHVILAEVHPAAEVRQRNGAAAEDLLATLARHALNRDAATDGILLKSAYSVPHGLGVSGATAWGDFYYGLALALARKALPLQTALGVEPFHA